LTESSLSYTTLYTPAIYFFEAYGGVVMVFTEETTRSLFCVPGDFDGTFLYEDARQILPNDKANGPPALIEFKGELYLVFIGKFGRIYIAGTKESDIGKWPTDATALEFSTAIAPSVCEIDRHLFISWIDSYNIINLSHSLDAVKWDPYIKIFASATTKYAPSIFRFKLELCITYVDQDGKLRFNHNVELPF